MGVVASSCRQFFRHTKLFLQLKNWSRGIGIVEEVAPGNRMQTQALVVVPRRGLPETGCVANPSGFTKNLRSVDLTEITVH